MANATQATNGEVFAAYAHDWQRRITDFLSAAPTSTPHL